MMNFMLTHTDTYDWVHDAFSKVIYDTMVFGDYFKDLGSLCQDKNIGLTP